MILHTMNSSGNVHSAAKFCSDFGLAPYVLQIIYQGGYNSIVVFRFPDKETLQEFKDKGVI